MMQAKAKAMPVKKPRGANIRIERQPSVKKLPAGNSIAATPCPRGGGRNPRGRVPVGRGNFQDSPGRSFTTTGD